jgi:hypothetical protein
MQKKIIIAASIIAVILIACKSGEKKNEHEGHNMNTDTSRHATTTEEKEIKTVAVSFTNLDAKLAASIKEIVDHYLHIRNGLAADDSKEAASAGQAMVVSMKKIDKSLFTADQKNVFDELEDDLKEHAGHIEENSGNIKHQREHFFMMSVDVYDLVKAFGGGQPLYHDHCPMYNEDKGGAMWLSELKEIKNPFFGSQMLKCGTVEEVIK